MANAATIAADLLEGRHFSAAQLATLARAYQRQVAQLARLVKRLEESEARQRQAAPRQGVSRG